MDEYNMVEAQTITHFYFYLHLFKACRKPLKWIIVYEMTRENQLKFISALYVHQ